MTVYDVQVLSNKFDWVSDIAYIDEVVNMQ